jgi:hypothetical protein
MMQQGARRFTDKLQKKYNPLKRICLSDSKCHSLDMILTSTEDPPSFLPYKFAVLLRPGAHMAWLETV